jgi:nucleotide-binding universal stress UspA family protein
MKTTVVEEKGTTAVLSSPGREASLTGGPAIRKEADACSRSSLRLKSILLPIDFSGPSLSGLEFAVALAHQFGARITLLHVTEPVGLPDFANSFRLIMQHDKVIAACKEQLEGLIKQYCVDAKVVGDVLVREGRSFHEITEAARSLRSDIIVMATHGYTGLRHTLLGSTAERVVRHSPCPVLVVRQRQECEAKSPGGMGKILVPIDFSEGSEKALDYTRLLAERNSAEVTLIHVVAPIPYYGQGDSGIFGYGVSEPDYAAMEAAMRAQSSIELCSLAREEMARGVSTTTLVRTGYPAIEIVERARNWPADLIVISTHGRTGLGHVFLGSVAEQVVRRAPCSVLVVR